MAKPGASKAPRPPKTKRLVLCWLIPKSYQTAVHPHTKAQLQAVDKHPFQPADADHRPCARIALELRSTSGTFTKHQAGATVCARLWLA